MHQYSIRLHNLGNWLICHTITKRNDTLWLENTIGRRSRVHGCDTGAVVPSTKIVTCLHTCTYTTRRGDNGDWLG